MAGSIQSTINQAFSVASLLVAHNPSVKAMNAERAESKAAAKRSESIEAQHQVVSEAAKAAETPIERAAALDELSLIGTEQKISAKQSFEKSPSKESYRAYQEAKSRSKTYGELAEEASKQAKEFTLAKQRERSKGRRKFSDYSKRILEAQGVDTRRLSDKEAYKLTKGYSQSERRKIMDREDLKAKIREI